MLGNILKQAIACYNTHMDIRIIVAAHKEAPMPTDDMYLPVFAGSSLADSIPEGYQADNEGENISFLNPMYCELTALYWGWKNIPGVTSESSYLGMVHYRRWFGCKRKGAFGKEDIIRYIGKKKVMVPRARNYYIETLKTHYCHTHGSSTLDECENVIRELYPEYLESFNKALSRSYGYMFNMMIMRGDLLDQYLSWLFKILYELTLRIDNTGMDDYDRRYPGRIAELLLNVWIEYMRSTGVIKHHDVGTLPWYCTTGDNRKEKAKALLKAKYKGEKYHNSF